MDLYKLIQALEKLIFEVASWLIYIPVTLFRILVRPRAIRASVQAEFARPPAERYQSLLSPPLLWTFVGLFPAFAALEQLRDFDAVGDEVSFLDDYILLDWALEARLFTIAVGLIAAPVAFAVAALVVTRKPITRANLEPEFHAQCYIFAPFQLALAAALLLGIGWIINAIVSAIAGGSGNTSDWFEWSMYLSFAAGVVWFCVAESFYFRHALREGSSKRVSGRRFLLAIVVTIAIWAAIAALLLFASEATVSFLKEMNRATHAAP